LYLQVLEKVGILSNYYLVCMILMYIIQLLLLLLLLSSSSSLSSPPPLLCSTWRCNTTHCYLQRLSGQPRAPAALPRKGMNMRRVAPESKPDTLHKRKYLASTKYRNTVPHLSSPLSTNNTERATIRRALRKYLDIGQGKK